MLKKIFPNLTLTLVAILLVYNHFFETSTLVQNVSSIVFVIYSTILVVGIVVALLVFFITWFFRKFKSYLENDTMEDLAKIIDNVYTTVGSNKENIISTLYSPLFSLVVIFFSFQSGLFFLMFVEAVSEFLNLSLLDRAKSYLKIKKTLSENE